MNYDYDRLYAKVDLTRIQENLKEIKSHLSSDVGVLAVLKADAYGHGARVVANFIKEGIAMAGVAGVSEALNLRKAFPESGGFFAPSFDKPILVLGYTHSSMFKVAVENDITLTLFDKDSSDKLNDVAKKMGRVANVHIAVDTGMRRIGVLPNHEGEAVIEYISKLSNIKITGIFSHFACADEEDGEATTKKQSDLFRDFCEKLKNKGIDIGIMHLSNSAGVILKNNDYKLVRAGIILYGNYPSPALDELNLRIKPSMSLITRVVSIRTLEKGDGVSYGHTFVAKKRMKIATLSAGYADGILRSLSEKGEVIIHEKRAKILGKICMDQMMVDVTDIPGVVPGDEALIYGETEKGTTLTLEEVSSRCGSFNYELMCENGIRVPHAYYINSKEVEFVSYI